MTSLRQDFRSNTHLRTLDMTNTDLARILGSNGPTQAGNPLLVLLGGLITPGTQIWKECLQVEESSQSGF